MLSATCLTQCSIEQDAAAQHSPPHPPTLCVCMQFTPVDPLESISTVAADVSLSQPSPARTRAGRKKEASIAGGTSLRTTPAPSTKTPSDSAAGHRVCPSSSAARCGGVAASTRSSTRKKRSAGGALQKTPDTDAKQPRLTLPSPTPTITPELFGRDELPVAVDEILDDGQKVDVRLSFNGNSRHGGAGLLLEVVGEVAETQPDASAAVAVAEGDADDDGNDGAGKYCTVVLAKARSVDKDGSGKVGAARASLADTAVSSGGRAGGPLLRYDMNARLDNPTSAATTVTAATTTTTLTDGGVPLSSTHTLRVNATACRTDAHVAGIHAVTANAIADAQPDATNSTNAANTGGKAAPKKPHATPATCQPAQSPAQTTASSKRRRFDVPSDADDVLAANIHGRALLGLDGQWRTS